MRDVVGIWALWYGNEQKVGSAEKNCGYGLPDRIMCGDAGRWGHGCGGAAAVKGCTRISRWNKESEYNRAGWALRGGRKILRPYI